MPFQIAYFIGTPSVNNLQQQSFEYSYTLVGAGFPCVGSSTPTISGVITVDPAEQLVLTSGAGTDSQTICVDQSIIDIVYEFRGSADAAAFTSPIGLPRSKWYILAKATSFRNYSDSWISYNN